MRPSTLLATLALCAGTFGCTSDDTALPDTERVLGPNLLLATIDTLRADRLGCYGGPADVGLEICALAEGGIRFEWAFSTAPATAPSIASLFTSLYPPQHGVTQSATTVLAPDFTTLSELLERAGYTTAAFVSNPVLDRGRGVVQGFQVYDQRMTRRERNRPGFAEREARATTDTALAWAQLAAKPPWFLWVHYQDPHGPYEPPGATAENDDRGVPPLPLLDNQTGIGGIPEYQRLPGLSTPGPYERRYEEEIRYLGPHLERLVSGLDALGRPPAVILTSDHGEAFGEDGVYFAHGHSVALDQIRVPLLWRPAGTAPARPGVEVERDPVTTLDIAPTLLALAGVEIPAHFEGRTLPLDPLDRKDRADQKARAIYSVGPFDAAVIAGGEYFARPRGDLPDDGAATVGKQVVRLPPRTAPIPFAKAPHYSAIAERRKADRALVELLGGFLGREWRAPTKRGDVSDTTRRRLRALGYVD